MASGRRGLNGRHRDRGGKIEKKHGNTRVGSPAKGIRRELRQGSSQGHDAQDVAQRNRLGLIARVFEATSQVGWTEGHGWQVYSMPARLNPSK